MRDVISMLWCIIVKAYTESLGRRGGNYLDDKTCLLPREVFIIAVEYNLTGNTRSFI